MAIKLFARISIAEWLLTNTFYIIDAIFSAATWLIGKVLTGGVKKMSLSKAQLKLFEEVDPIESIVLLIFGFICLVVVIVLAMVMIYTVYSRFFKVLCIRTIFCISNRRCGRWRNGTCSQSKLAKYDYLCVRRSSHLHDIVCL